MFYGPKTTCNRLVAWVSSLEITSFPPNSAWASRWVGFVVVGCGSLWVPTCIRFRGIVLFFHESDFGGFAFKTIVLQHYWELETHINTRKTSDGGPKRLQTVFETDANKYFFRGITTVKVIVDGHGTRLHSKPAFQRFGKTQIMTPNFIWTVFEDY